MEYRGVEYTVVQLLEGGWRWEIDLGDGKRKSGETPSSRALRNQNRTGRDRSTHQESKVRPRQLAASFISSAERLAVIMSAGIGFEPPVANAARVAV